MKTISLRRITLLVIWVSKIKLCSRESTLEKRELYETAEKVEVYPSETKFGFIHKKEKRNFRILNVKFILLRIYQILRKNWRLRKKKKLKNIEEKK